MLVPSGSPNMINIIALNATALRMSWEEPPAGEQNGLITNYIINMTVVETGESWHFMTTETSIELQSLHPFYTYNFLMAAATVNGTGPYSSVFTIQMPPDGEYNCCMYGLSFMYMYMSTCIII